jgi:chorismate mutase
MKATTPEACQSIDDARAEIDRIDRKLIALVQRRHLFGERIAELRGGSLPPDIAGMYLSFLRDRQEWGAELGVEPEFIDRLFSVIAKRFYDRRTEDAAKRGGIFVKP